jgi:hypothetical protein
MLKPLTEVYLDIQLDGDPTAEFLLKIMPQLGQPVPYLFLGYDPDNPVMAFILGNGSYRRVPARQLKLWSSYLESIS